VTETQPGVPGPGVPGPDVPGPNSIGANDAPSPETASAAPSPDGPSSGAVAANVAAADAERPRWKRHVGAFLAGQTVSLFGSMLVQYAVFWYLAIQFQSGVMMTLAAAFGFLPQAVVSLFGGVWADRHNRKWLIIGADATIALSTLALALVMLAGFTEPWLIFVVLAIRSAGAGVQMPAVSALIPQITPQAQLIRVNGFLGSIQSAMALVAPAAAGIVYAANTGGDASPLAIVPILFVDVVTAAIGITLLSTIPVSTIRSGASAATGVIADLVEGVRYVADHAFVRWVLVLFGIIFVLTVAPSNLMPLMLVRSFPSGEQGDVVNLAVFEMCFSVGMVLGGVLVATLASGWDRVRLIAASSLTFGMLAIALGLAPSLIVVFAVMFLIGLAVPFFSTPSMTLLQETVEPERQGRVFGFVGIVMAVGMPLGMLVFGPLADVMRVETIIVATGIITIAVVALALWLPAGRRAVAAAHEMARTAGSAPAPEAE
jgi:DHA3 family macrolide efflux protein-like MFS transporter